MRGRSRECFTRLRGRWGSEKVADAGVNRRRIVMGVLDAGLKVGCRKLKAGQRRGCRTTRVQRLVGSQRIERRPHAWRGDREGSQVGGCLA